MKVNWFKIIQVQIKITHIKIDRLIDNLIYLQYNIIYIFLKLFTRNIENILGGRWKFKWLE